MKVSRVIDIMWLSHKDFTEWLYMPLERFYDRVQMLWTMKTFHRNANNFALEIKVVIASKVYKRKPSHRFKINCGV